MRLRVFSQRLTWCLMFGLIPAALHVALSRTGLLFRLGWDLWPEWVSLAPVALGLLAGALWGLAYRVSDFEAAHAADLALGLRERLGSAVAFANDPPASRAILAAILADASAHCADVQPRAVVGGVLPRRTIWVSMLGCALAGLWFAPPQNWFVTPREVAERQAIREEGKRLLDLAKEVERAGDPADLARNERIARKIEAVGKSLARGSMSKREAMKALAELTDELKSAHQQLAQKAAAKQLKTAVQRAKERGTETPEVSGMLRALGEGNLKEAQSQLGKMQERLAAGGLSSAEQQQLAKDLRTVAESLQGTSAEAAAQAMQSAAQSIDEQDLSGAAEQLGDAEKKLPEGEGAQQLSEMQQLEELSREVEFSEDKVANPTRLGGDPGKQTSGESPESSPARQPRDGGQAMQQRGDRLSSAGRDVQRKAQETGSKRNQELARKAQDLGEKMSSGQADPKQAAEEAQKLRDEAQQAKQQTLEQNGAGTVEKALQQAAAQGIKTQAAEKMAEALAKGNADQAAKQLEGMAQQLQNMTPEQQKAMAEDLKSLAQNLDGTAAKQLAEAMQKAGQSMDKQQAEQAAQALEKAAQQLSQQEWVQRLAESGQLDQLLQQLGGADGMDGANGGGGQNGEGDGQDDLGEPDGGAGLAESAPGLLGVRGKNTRVRGQAGDLGDSPSIDVKGLGPSGTSSTPYYSVRAPSKIEVQDALERENIPAADRPLVQDYFKSLQGQ
jgi:hypothetical protein